MNVQLVRLSNGELILADVEVNGTDYILKNPFSMQMTGPNQLALIPWMQIADFDRKSGVTFYMSKVDYMLSPEKKIKEEYIKTVSGVQIATPQMLQENRASDIISAAEMTGGGKLKLTD